jgi:hypothetical protein
MKVMVFALVATLLISCGVSEPPSTPETAAQQQSEYAGQGTAIDAQAKVLNDAKKVEQQQIDANTERMKESGAE